MKVNCQYRTDIGTFRKVNQDAVTYLTKKTGQVMGVVCDGLGGHKCGEVASTMAINLITEYFNNTDLNAMKTDDAIKLWLHEKINQIQVIMGQYSMRHPEASDMGTTMVAVLIANNKAYCVNIGDSRIYSYSPNKGLAQLTKDHNVLNLYLQDKKKVQGEVDFNQTYWKALTSALGSVKNLTIDVFAINPELPSYFLLTSDGVHDFVDPEEMMAILNKRGTINSKVKHFIKKAINNVSTDNVTAMLMHLS